MSQANAEKPERDCGSSVCRYAKRPLRGMRNNGGCRCDECRHCGCLGRTVPHYQWCPVKPIGVLGE